MNDKKKIVVLIEKEYNNSKTSYISVNYTEDENKCCLYKTINNFTIVILPQDSNISPQNIKKKFKGEIVKVIYSETHCPNNNEWKKHQCKKVLISEKVFGSEGIKATLLKKKLTQTDIQQILNDPLIIIFTLEGATREDYPEWAKAKELLKNNKGKGYDYINNQIPPSSSNNPRIVEFTRDDYTILFVKENELEKKNAQGGIDDLLEKILSEWGKGLKKEDIYVAVHALNDYLKDESKFKDKVAYICDFHHLPKGPDKEFCDLLIGFLEEKKDVKEICEKIKELAMCERKKISIIKHKIGNIFLPVDIDLQGLVETSFDGEYFKKVLEAWQNNKQENKLNKAREWIYNSKSGTTQKEKCLEEIKDEAKQTKKDEKEKEEIENIWGKLKAILPENEKESVEEKLKGLRELYNKAKEILECLNNGNIEKLKEICKDGRNPFHEWFSKLCDILDELGEKIGE
ncbi:MAG: hypothetical protein NC926_09415 [Candidatus Omnitrophica bacterium]|nr:hypothetical protein [Candidatus Omnitrophota bacterium]